jgi:thioredoxin reductase
MIALGETSLIVVGCGPTGVAALFQAALEGIPAIGIEAGPAPLASIQGYMDGLVFTSPATHFEVGGIPLDCTAVDYVTREDVLSYYARLITYRSLDIRCGTRCLRLEPRKGHVEVTVETAGGPGAYRAERVLVTSWHERRPLPAEIFTAETPVPVHLAIQQPTQLAGKSVAILGGGMSGHEYAVRLLLNGQRVTILARGEAHPRYEDPRLRALLAATGSALWDQVTEVAVGRSEVGFTRLGARHTVPCDALVGAVGHRLRDDVLAMLAAAGVLSPAEVGGLRRARSFEKLLREYPEEDESSVIRRAGMELPDFRQHLFEGKRGIHLAGGALHGGAANSGLMYSIVSATLAVKAIAGHSPPPGSEAPLPQYISALDLPKTIPAALGFARSAALLPLRVWGRTRNTISLGFQESGLGNQTRKAESDGGPPAAYAPRHDDPEMERILAAADGTRSVAELADHFAMDSEEDQGFFWRVLRHLWRNGSLTWLPPASP